MIKLVHKFTVEFPEDIWREIKEKKGPGSIKDFLIRLIRKEFELQKIKTFILAGGEGARLKPLTESIPKALIPVGYKPLLEHNIELLEKNGITDVILLIGKLGNRIMKYFGQKWNTVDISYVSESTLLDTAGAVENAKNLISNTFIVMNSDILTNVKISEIIQSHKQNKNECIATVCGINIDNYSQKIGNLEDKTMFSNYGIFEIEEYDGNRKRVVNFDEKLSKKQKEGYIDMGIYVFEPEILTYLKDSKEKSLSRDIIPLLIKQEKVNAFISPNNVYWIDVARPERWSKAWDALFSGAIEP